MFRVGNSSCGETVSLVGDLVYIKFDFNAVIKDEIKVIMDSPRFDFGTKLWVAKNSPRTQFGLDFLRGKRPYAHYDKPITQIIPNRPSNYAHQVDLASFALARRQCIWAAEMGVGKTLAMIEVMEKIGGRWWFVAPKSALISVRADYVKWGAKVTPEFMTYEQMVKRVESGDYPHHLCFDEASKLKNAQAKRTQAAMHVANWVRQSDGMIVLMSGTPAPKSPVDWWALCEIARPGFIREGHPAKFTDRLALVKKVEGSGGQTYPQIVTFWDNENKCFKCGRMKDHDVHSGDMLSKMSSSGADDFHDFVPSKNEVAGLHKRMNGLVKVVMKNDCLDLPEKIYRTIECTPSTQVKALAKMVVKTARSAAQALIQLRELSDGFQYHDKLVSTTVCEDCGGCGCTHCSDRGTIKNYTREAVRIDCPKIPALLDLLDEKEEDGRIIIYAGFTGSLNDIILHVGKAGWDWVRVDGSGWSSSFCKSADEMYRLFQDRTFDKKIAFVAHPKSGGMGLTLTASDTTVFYSNDFDGEARSQAEDRTYRPGTRGTIIIDLVHLPTDRQVIESLKNKRNMELMTLGELNLD